MSNLFYNYFAVFVAQPPERSVRVVLKDADPTLADCLRDEPLLLLQSFDGVQVVAHHPRGRKVRGRRQQVGKHERRLAFGIYPNALKITVVTRNFDHANAIDNLRISIDQI